MNKLFLILVCIIVAGCSNTFTRKSLQVLEYKTTASMEQHADCTVVGDVSAQYSVLKISPLDRTTAASNKLKDAAFDEGANALIKTSTFFGDDSDKAQGVAYQCVYG